MFSKLKLSVTILALTAAGCAGDATISAMAGATVAPAPAVDAAPVYTLSGDRVTSHSGVPVSGRDWNCPRCYK
jgi:hypothetical protein